MAILAVVTLLAAGCTGGRHRDSDLGAVPIPPPPTAQATPSAAENHPQLVAIGAPVRASLPESTAVVVATGPTEDLPSAGPMPQRVTGTITVTLSQATAPLTVTADDFSCRDEQGRAVALTPGGTRSATATPGRSATVTLTGTFGSGAAQITWRHHGNAVAIWDFTIELD